MYCITRLTSVAWRSKYLQSRAPRKVFSLNPTRYTRNAPRIPSLTLPKPILITVRQKKGLESVAKNTIKQKKERERLGPK